MAKIPIALQLFSIRENCEKDLAGTLAQVAGMGYDGVEFAGYYDNKAEQIKGLLDTNGLKVAGAHVGFHLFADDVFEQTVEFHKVIGCTFLIVPGFPQEYRESADGYARAADRLNEIAERLVPHGMVTGYHNHSHEFQMLDGAVPWEVIFDRARPEVIMQIDIGNAMRGGGDPISYFAKYPGRSRSVHLKEYSESNPDAPVGDGDVDWRKVFAECEAHGGTEWYVVEYERKGVDKVAAVKKCVDNLRSMDK